MDKRHLKKKKKREKKRARAKRRPPRRERVLLPEADESILKRMKPLNPPEVVTLGEMTKGEKPKVKSKGFNRDTFMKDGSGSGKPKKEQEPSIGFKKGSWIDG